MRDLSITAFAPLLWGTTYLITTEFLPADRPFLTAVLRALPIGIMITLIYRKFPYGHWWWRVFVVGVLNIGIFFALLFIATYRLPGGVVATVGAIQPLVVMFLSWLILGEKPPQLALGAGGMSILGVGMLVFDPMAQLDVVGVFAAIGATLSMGMGIVLTKYWGNPTTLLPFTAWQLVAGGIFLLPITLMLEPPLQVLSLQNALGYLWLGVVNTGIAYGLWFRGIKYLRPLQISFLGLWSPIIAVVLGYIFLSQEFGVRQWFGVGLILLSITLANVGRR